ncbi:UDP-glucoronosyl and UDP-glucosyl transferase [Clostridium beijerinckii]|uniref:UDP-glucoronosyl and UDP-glucosyl transferase n=1 Tax=Clostridium beijerinckii TaxID=1520 RepID=A0A0B5QEK9_CLOBE|nr:nucleotide disphospho-sugar-binding domain-containing protein [Clostridium beijerinckii]AJG99435.1 UDP-glucoronosyl and UDP-glucosyl transferase [Clostridium beijerinckii]
MRVLITPMSAIVETKGPFSRTILLANEFIKRGHEVALCAAEDPNYHSIENVKNYYAPIPSMLDISEITDKNILKKLQEKTMNSFEEVLNFIGAINEEFFANDVHYIRKAIQEFNPDVIYTEFRIAAIVAAKLERIKVATGFSFTVQKSFACNPEYSGGVNKYLEENNLNKVESVLEIFDWANLKVVPSSYEIEPIDEENVVFVGPLSSSNTITVKEEKNKIVAYMGNGTISPMKLIEELTKAFENSKYEVYIATEEVEPYKKNNININKRFDFNKLMPEAMAYINHGGQNSIMTGLMYGVPQIICPGNVFERKYNASSIVKLNAGKILEAKDFDYKIITRIIDEFNEDSTYANNSKKSGEMLLSLGGVTKAVQAIEELV